MSVTGYLYLPDVYAAPAEFSIRSCGKSVLAYTNVSGRITSDATEVTRVPSAELASLSRIVQWVYKQKTYFNVRTRTEITITNRPVPITSTKTLITFSSKFQCNNECDLLNNVAYNPNNAITSSDNPTLVHIGNDYNIQDNTCGSYYSRPVVTLVQLPKPPNVSPVTAVIGRNYINFLPGVYQLKFSVVRGGATNGAASHGQGISWNDTVKYSSELTNVAYPGVTGGIQTCSNVVGDFSDFNCILYEDNGWRIFYERAYSDVLVKTTNYPYNDFGGVNVMMQWEPIVNPTPNSAPTFHTPALKPVPVDPANPFVDQFSFVFIVPFGQGEYYINLGSIMTYYSDRIRTTAAEQRTSTNTVFSDYSVEMEIFLCA